jgi:hypothetical protein
MASFVILDAVLRVQILATFARRRGRDSWPRRDLELRPNGRGKGQKPKQSLL